MQIPCIDTRCAECRCDLGDVGEIDTENQCRFAVRCVECLGEDLSGRGTEQTSFVQPCSHNELVHSVGIDDMSQTCRIEVAGS